MEVRRRMDTCTRISSWLRECMSQRKQALKVGDTPEEEMNAQDDYLNQESGKD